jgi:hypothetical protein
MSNSLNSVGTLIAQKSLDLLVNKYPALSLVASDFSDQSAPYGSAVKTRVITPGTAPQFNGTTGYAAQDLNTSAVTVTINRHPHATFSLNSQELTSASPTMIADYANLVASEIGDAIYTDIAALFTSGNYPGGTVVPTAHFGYTGVINQANTSLNSRKVPKDRIAIFNSTLYGSMFNDSIVRNDPNKYVIGENELPRIQGTVLTDYPDLPALTHGQVGVILNKSAIAFAARLPEDVTSIGGTPKVSQVNNVVHPDLGLAMQVRTWEDPKFGSLNVSATLMYGVAVGNSGSAQIIRTTL